MYTTAVVRQTLTWLTAVSQVSAPQLPWLGSALLAGLRYSSPLLHLGSDPQIRNWLASGK